MTIYNATVLRRAEPAATLPGLLQNRQLGISSDSKRLAFKDAGGVTTWFYNKADVDALIASLGGVASIWKLAVETRSALPGAPVENDVYLIKDEAAIVFWDGSAWVNVAGGSEVAGDDLMVSSPGGGGAQNFNLLVAEDLPSGLNSWYTAEDDGGLVVVTDSENYDRTTGLWTAVTAGKYRFSFDGTTTTGTLNDMTTSVIHMAIVELVSGVVQETYRMYIPYNPGSVVAQPFAISALVDVVAGRQYAFCIKESDEALFQFKGTINQTNTSLTIKNEVVSGDSPFEQDRVYYLDGANGDDLKDGKTPADAFKTPKKAIENAQLIAGAPQALIVVGITSLTFDGSLLASNVFPQNLWLYNDTNGATLTYINHNLTSSPVYMRGGKHSFGAGMLVQSQLDVVAREVNFSGNPTFENGSFIFDVSDNASFISGGAVQAINIYQCSFSVKAGKNIVLPAGASVKQLSSVRSRLLLDSPEISDIDANTFNLSGSNGFPSLAIHADSLNVGGFLDIGTVVEEFSMHAEIGVITGGTGDWIKVTATTGVTAKITAFVGDLKERTALQGGGGGTETFAITEAGAAGGGDGALANGLLAGTNIDVFTFTYVKDGADWFIEAEKEGGGDGELDIGGVVYSANCTTGAGTAGKARSSSAVTLGTISDPKVNFIFWDISDSVPRLRVSTLSPYATAAPFAWGGVSTFMDDTYTTAEGWFLYQRYNDGLTHGLDMRGQISHIGERVRQIGTKTIAGLVSTVTITPDAGVDLIQIATTTAQIYQLHIQTIAGQAPPIEYYVVNDPVTPFKKITDLNEANTTSDGTSLRTNNSYYGLEIGISVPSEGQNPRVLVWLPDGKYSTETGAINDTSNYSSVAIDINYQAILARVCRLALKYVSSGDTITNLLPSPTSTQDRRNWTFGGGGGGGGGAGASNAIDVLYSNTISGLTATEVQGAIDELASIAHADSIPMAWAHLENVTILADTSHVFNIPADAQQLRIDFWIKGKATGDGSSRVGIRFNSDTAGNYYQILAGSDGSTAHGGTVPGLQTVADFINPSTLADSPLLGTFKTTLKSGEVRNFESRASGFDALASENESRAHGHWLNTADDVSTVTLVSVGLDVVASVSYMSEDGIPVYVNGSNFIVVANGALPATGLANTVYGELEA